MAGVAGFLVLVVAAATLGGREAAEISTAAATSSEDVASRAAATKAADSARLRRQAASIVTTVPPSPLPSDVSYTKLSDEAMPPYRRSLDILLNKKVSEDVLTTIAHELRNRDPRTFERTFIVYYLPGMEVGTGGWATTHFNPNLKVVIQGTTREQEQALTSARPSPGRNVVGQWLDDRPFMASRLTIYRSGGQLFLERRYPDGSSGDSRLRERATPQGRRFEEIGRQTGDYFLMDVRGDLQIRDAEGLLATARKVN